MVSVVLHNRDLRVHDHPALSAAVHSAGSPSAGRLVPVFVLDDTLLRAPTMGANRVAYLLEALTDLRDAYEGLGSGLVFRRGEPAATVIGLLAEFKPSAGDLCPPRQPGRPSVVHVSEDWTPVARARQSRLERVLGSDGVRFERHPGIGIVDVGDVVPASGGWYKVFTPFFRTWSEAPRRAVLGRPRHLPLLPPGLEPGRIPTLAELTGGGIASDPLGHTAWAPLALGSTSPRRVHGGEDGALRRVEAFEGARQPGRYDEVHDDLAAAGTSRLSADLHFGCLSPRRLEQWALDRAGPGTFVRQLCWREFYLSVTRSFPEIARVDYRPHGRTWRADAAELEAWKNGETGEPLVDAAMHQLREEGFVHNRGRLVAASYLTKSLGHHWTEGADYYMAWLTDGDVASNSGNWQWMAGTGNDTRPNRRLSPLRQAVRFDRDGQYRRRYGAG